MMEIINSGRILEASSSLQSSRPGKPDAEDRPKYNTDQRAQVSAWDLSNDSADTHESSSTSASTAEQDIERDGGEYDRMIEKWRMIKFADKNRSKKKVADAKAGLAPEADVTPQIYHTYNDHTSLFGKDYSKFYEAFQQGLNPPQSRLTIANKVPAKRRSVETSTQAFKRRRPDEHAPLLQSDQHQTPALPAQRSAGVITEASVAENPSELAPPSLGAEDSSLRPEPRSDSATQGKISGMIDGLINRTLNLCLRRLISLIHFSSVEQPSRRKGVGLYAGNWEYVTDEEKVPEYVRVAQETADVEGRTTRRAYAKLTSSESRKDSGSLLRSSFENQLRKSGRARNPINYAVLSTAEDITAENSTPAVDKQNVVTPEQAAKQMSPSTSVSSNSNRSTLMHDGPSRSTSTSTATNTEQFERPKLSWNAIVYEILALADGPLTFTDLTENIRNRYPFFKHPTQEKVLKSGLKNPLYFHEAFIKGDVIEGKQTWGLKPGQFVDKKTGDVLTPQPRNPIVPHTRTEPEDEDAVSSSVDQTPQVPQSRQPRTSNPRFGRDILNSPEIPDSQAARLSTSSSQGESSHRDAEHTPNFEESIQFQTNADAGYNNASTVSPKSDTSVQAADSKSHGAVTIGSLKNATHHDGFSKTMGPTDYEASIKETQPVSAFHSTGERALSTLSFTGGGGNDSSAKASKFVSVPISHEPIASTQRGTISPENGVAASQTPDVIPATPMPYAVSIASTQLYVILFLLSSSFCMTDQ